MKTVIDILQDLVKIDSTNPPGNEKEVVDYLRQLFVKRCSVLEIEHSNNRSSLVIDINGNSEETIAFIGHIDTVPVNDRFKWELAPFSATIKGDLLYGRGASDMKSGVACMTYTGLYFLENNITPNKNIRLIYTADEESDGEGIKSVLRDELLDDVTNIIVPENTDEYIVIKEKGALWLKLQIYGKSAHGARPDLGLNSIELMYEFVQSVRPYIESYSTDNLLNNNTISVNKIKGGEKTNIIADYCEAEIDIRTNPDLKNEKVIEYVNNQVIKFNKKYSQLKIDIEIINNRTALEINEDHEFIADFKDVLSQLGYEVKVKGVNYFTDLSLSLPVINKPFLIFGPGFEEIGHKINENVSISAVKNVADIYIAYCKK